MKATEQYMYFPEGGAVYYAVQGGSNIEVHGGNPTILQCDHSTESF